MAEHRHHRNRRTIRLDEAALTALLPAESVVVSVTSYNNPIAVCILADGPDWEPIGADVEAPLEDLVIAGGDYFEPCVTGNEQGECVLIDGHDKGAITEAQNGYSHINRHGIPWRIEMGMVRDEIVIPSATTITTSDGIAPAPGTPIQDYPPRGNDPRDFFNVHWESCDRGHGHPAHWIRTDQTAGEITNCQGRDDQGEPLPIPFR